MKPAEKRLMSCVCPPDRDRFVLSKGHAVPMLYLNLAEKGFIPKEELATLRQAGSAVCEVLSETCPVPVKRLGLTDYSESGDYEEILKKAGLSAACIAEKAEEMIKGN